MNRKPSKSYEIAIYLRESAEHVNSKKYAVVVGARAYAANGNYLAADESCEYQPGQIDSSRPIQLEKRTAFGTEPDYDLLWNAAAEERLKRVPSFARGMVVKSVEKYAREHGHQEITPELMKAVKSRFDKTGIPSFRPRR